MKITFFFLSGFILSFLGALPLGTVNLAVINSSIAYKKKAVKRIAIAAGFSEVIIAVFAYKYGNTILNTISNYIFLQYFMVAVLFSLAIYFFTRKEETQKTVNLHISDFNKGFLLGLANPSVWAYWVIAIATLTSKISIEYTNFITPISSIVFFAAVYFGKLFALLLYGKIGKQLITQKKSFKNTLIGSLLTITATIQLITQLL